MQIDDIPLPQSMPGKYDNNDHSNITNNQNHFNPPLKRLANHKLPVGLLRKKNYERINDSISTRKELFLPSENDRLQVTLNGSQRQSMDVHISKISTNNSKSSGKIQSENHQNAHRNRREPEGRRKESNQESKWRDTEYVDDNDRNVHGKSYSKSSSKRKYNEYFDDYEAKRSRMYDYRRREEAEYERMRIRSQVVVCSREEKYERRWHREDYHEDHRRPWRATSPRRRSPSVKRRPRPPQRRPRSPQSPLRPPSARTASWSPSHRSSFLSSSPVIGSPPSPEDSPREPSPPRQSPLAAALAANACLRSLKDTLEAAATAACSKCLSRPPDITPPYETTIDATNEEVGAIPLPTEGPRTPSAPGRSPGDGGRGPANGNSTVSLGSHMSCESGPRSHCESLCGGGDSEAASDTRASRQETRPRLSLPRTTGTGLLTDRPPPPGLEGLGCVCVPPDPDEWLAGVRACGNGRPCLMRRLAIECSPRCCPAGEMCANQMFASLDRSPGGWRSRVRVCWGTAGAWTLSTVADTPRGWLLFEVAGRAVAGEGPRAEGQVQVTRGTRLALEGGGQSLAGLLGRGGPPSANVRLEKWLVAGGLRLGLFADQDLPAHTELILDPSRDCVYAGPSLEGGGDWREGEEGVAGALRWLVHEAGPGEAAAVAQALGDSGAVLASLGAAPLLAALALGHALPVPEPPAIVPPPTGPQDALYALECRLPPFWRARTLPDTPSGPRVCFWHVETGRVQWEMPVYPWEGHGEPPWPREAGEPIYDYDGASEWPVMRAEVAARCQDLQERYRARMRRQEAARGRQEACRTGLFRARVSALIQGLLAPFREEDCPRGRITSEDDLRYLAGKLTQTILLKELRQVGQAAEKLAVTALVETKTRAYVQSYLESRGPTYQRPSKPAAPA